MNRTIYFAAAVCLFCLSTTQAQARDFYINLDGVTISTDGEYLIYGNGQPTTNTILVNPGVVADITLQNVNIESGSCAFDISDATVTLRLSGENTLKSSYRAGLFAPEGATLTITSKSGNGSALGTLNATGGDFSAGIGAGGLFCSGGNITILGGTVNATGGQYGAGIGGSHEGSGGVITISGGTVNATGGDHGAGIGGGTYCDGGVITISGGTVNATGGYSGAGIGGGFDGSGGDITISGGTINATGGDTGAGIGGGIYGSSGEITISGGTGFARGGNHSVGIGAGRHGSDGTVTITDGTIVAINGSYAANATNSAASQRSASDASDRSDRLEVSIAIQSQLQVYVGNGWLYVISPVDEYISIYSSDGATLYRTGTAVPANTTTGIVDVCNLSFSGQGVIVKGSSGWAKKLLIVYNS